MKILIPDIYGLYNNKNIKFPKKFKDFTIIWNLREALLLIANGDITDIAIPKEKLPGYDFGEFIDELFCNKQIDSIEVYNY